MNKLLAVSCWLLIAGCGEVSIEPAKAETPKAETKAAAPAVSKSVPEGWTEDFEAAKAAAKKEGKKILAVFSGSDWCYWCKILEESHLSKPDFVSELTNDFELVFIDTPQDTSGLSELARKQNPELLTKYAIEAFPSVKILDDKGNVLAEPRTGRGETPVEYAAKIRRELTVGPIVRKHLVPFEDEVKAGYRAVGEKFANMEQPKDEASKKAMFELTQKEVAALSEKFKNLLARVEAAQMPSEIDAEKKAFVGQLRQTISGFEERLKLTWEDVKKMEEDAAKQAAASTNAVSEASVPFYKDDAWAAMAHTNKTVETIAVFGSRVFVPTLMAEINPKTEAERKLAETFSLRLYNSAAFHQDYIAAVSKQADEQIKADPGRASWFLRSVAARGHKKAVALQEMDALMSELQKEDSRADFARLFASFTAWTIVGTSEKDVRRQAFVESLADWMAHRGNPVDARVAYYWLRPYGKHLLDDALPVALENRQVADPWLAVLWRAKIAAERAWESRGGAYAKDVKDEAWEGWTRHSDEMKKLIVRARELHPDYPEIALATGRTYFPTTSLRESDDFFRWATGLVLDDYDFYTDYLFYKCYPRWCGSLQAMRAFADACARADRPDTMLPCIAAVAHFKIAKEANRSLEEYFADTNLVNACEAGLRAMRERPELKYTRAWWLARYLLPVVVYTRGDYERVHEFCDFHRNSYVFGNPWDLVSGFSDKLAVIEGLSGPHHAELAALHRKLLAGDSTAFVRGVDDLAGRERLSADEKAYVRTYRNGAVMAGGDPLQSISAAFENSDGDFINYGGRWRFKDGKWSTGKVSSNGATLAWDVGLVRDFEAELTFWPNVTNRMTRLTVEIMPRPERQRSTLLLVHVLIDRGRIGFVIGNRYAFAYDLTTDPTIVWNEFSEPACRMRLRVEDDGVSVFLGDATSPVVSRPRARTIPDELRSSKFRLGLLGDDVGISSLSARPLAK